MYPCLAISRNNQYSVTIPNHGNLTPCKTIICSLNEGCIGKVAIGVYIHVGSAEPDIHASDNLTRPQLKNREGKKSFVHDLVRESSHNLCFGVDNGRRNLRYRPVIQGGTKQCDQQLRL